MSKAALRLGVAFLAVGGLAELVVAQPTISLKAIRRVNDMACTTTTNCTSAGLAGYTCVANRCTFTYNPPSNTLTGVRTNETIEAEVFVSNWSPSGQRLQSWQWTIDVLGFTSGPRGSFDFLQGRRTCVNDGICGDLGVSCGQTCFSNADCAHLGGVACTASRCVGWDGFCADNSPRAAGIIIDLERADSVFGAGPTACPAVVATDLLGARGAAAVLSTACAPLFAAPAKYAGSLKFRPTSNACGVFTIPLLAGDSTLFDTLNNVIGPLTLQGLTITIGIGTCVADTIVSGDPADCTIDARQHQEPGGQNPAGPSSFLLMLNGDSQGMTCGNFLVTQLPAGAPLVSCQAVTPQFGGIPEQILLTLNRRVNIERWTCANLASGGEPLGENLCINHFPGDVNSDTDVNLLDVDLLRRCLEQSPGADCDIHQCDLDRTNFCGPKDILRLADLENGAETYIPFLGRAIADCP